MWCGGRKVAHIANEKTELPYKMRLQNEPELFHGNTLGTDTKDSKSLNQIYKSAAVPNDSIQKSPLMADQQVETLAINLITYVLYLNRIYMVEGKNTPKC